MEDSSRLNMTKGSSIRILNLVKRYGDVLAVDDLSLEIKSGEFVTLLGPSGSGKTTTLMMVAGFELPNSGEIFVDDQPIIFIPAYKRGLGMVFQHYSLFPHMTVERNIGFPLRMRKLDKKERAKKIGPVLELVKLGGYENRMPRQLSGGQQQRVALARALVFNPRCLLMDEPLGALDKKLREHMQLEIKQITRSLNISVIYVTHDQSEAMTMSDRIAVMNDGKIVQAGPPGEIYDNPINYFVADFPPGEIYDNPINYFVADFIGESNFIEGKVEQSDHQTSYFKTERGIMFKASVNKQKSPGSKGHLVIRPEKISFVEQNQAYANQYEAVIEEIIYLGDTTTYNTILVQDGTALTIKQHNKANSRRLTKGDKIDIGWDEKDNCIV
jgi:ABC-type Fe3+/spermidine/putrescine transport system ATPase subunit